MNRLNTERNYFFDNLKALLIFFVVLGHLIEPYTGKFLYIYRIIYLFHIPIFTFCSGYFSTKQDASKIITNIIYPYFVFQLLYCLFNIYIIKIEGFKIDFTTPYWIMWYLTSMLLWNGLILLFRQTKKRKIFLSIIIAFAIGLLAGYSDTVGYYISLSRSLVFFPFFLLGYYFNQFGFTKKTITNNKYFVLFIVISSICTITYLYFNYNKLISTWLYSSASYNILNYNIMHRIKIYLCAIMLGLFLMILTPTSKNIFSFIGKNSMYVYLLHGFVVKLISKYHILANIQNNYVLLADIIVISFAILLVFASKPVAILLKPFVKLCIPKKIMNFLNKDVSNS
ncbi:acyltransferase family protein [Sedimentibacter sp. zth1]|uniref:acyltransferase family protein n=1 Tax=Sedimentibacter sp. zth1 TaxID=2816908 RepID=UPI001A9178C3|nr:acyltransferase family protein [Sedimentibacter sp. zth1]QSX05768.1 acyltransferase family protein [Sedimentibacter sp. zth1]